MNNKEINWENETSTNIVNHIVKTYHKHLQTEMPEISRLTTTILRVHGLEHKELSKVHRLFHIIKIDLDQHIIKKEVNIFPLIKIYDRRPSKELLEEIIEEINELESGRNDTLNLLKELRKVTGGYSAPEDGCITYDKTYAMLKELESNILDHFNLESNILFPRLKKGLNK